MHSLDAKNNYTAESYYNAKTSWLLSLAAQDVDELGNLLRELFEGAGEVEAGRGDDGRELRVVDIGADANGHDSRGSVAVDGARELRGGVADGPGAVGQDDDDVLSLPVADEGEASAEPLVDVGASEGRHHADERGDEEREPLRALLDDSGNVREADGRVAHVAPAVVQRGRDADDKLHLRAVVRLDRPALVYREAHVVDRALVPAPNARGRPQRGRRRHGDHAQTQRKPQQRRGARHYGKGRFGGGELRLGA
ncbi:unnamed protein product [Chondrus crispus]|uniref:Uncharacterized protein n=1 Tax=Chondrus crispus TaxID=2769 RepID=R7QDH9_CHOCR|nr:unnamed protein product [Chondrus crispus]CDF35481.1 unnamed protein product [Chondrus crispus]|eukprot:XP_005715300.1 unnamed protein product [Chondrus crispus]